MTKGTNTGLDTQGVENQTITLNGFEAYLLKEALNTYCETIRETEFSKNSIVTKGYMIQSITQLSDKLK